MDAQALIVVFNICAFGVVVLLLSVIWRELKHQEARRHDQIDDLWSRMAGLTMVTMDHGQRIARMEGMPFVPATIYEKVLGRPADAETREFLDSLTAHLRKGRT